MPPGRRLRRASIWWLGALLALVGCGGPPRYEGRSLADWQRDIQSVSPAVRLQAVGVLAEVGAPGVPALTAALTDQDATVRWRAARALSRMGTVAVGTVPALADRLARDADDRVRVAVAEALGAMGEAASAAVPVLVASLADRDADVRSSAALALGEIGEDARAVTALAAMLHDPEPGVRASAASALGTIGPGASAALPALVAALDDARPLVRRFAGEALRRIEAD